MGGQIVEVIASNFSLFKMAKKKILHSVFFQFDLPIVQPFTIQTINQTDSNIPDVRC